MDRRRKVVYPLSCWFIFFGPPRKQYESRSRYDDQTERSHPKISFVPKVEKIPTPAAPPPTSAAMVTPKADDTKKTPAGSATTTSASSKKEPQDNHKQNPELPKTQQTGKRKKAPNPPTSREASLQPAQQKTPSRKDQKPTRRQSVGESGPPEPRLKAAKHDQILEQAGTTKRVHFTTDTKKEDGGSIASFPSPGSSNDSRTDLPPKDLRCGARDPVFSSKGKSEAKRADPAHVPRLPGGPLAESDFGDLWSDESDGGGSAIDISDFASVAMREEQPALRGILKTRARILPNTQNRAHLTRHSQTKLAQSHAPQRQISPERLTFTSRNLERAKRSGYDPAFVHAIGRERSSAKAREQVKRGVRTDAEDYRVDMALEQAKSNGNWNKRASIINSSDGGPTRSRSPLMSTHSHRDSTQSRSSSRLEPIFVFRPSDCDPNDPGIVVHTQAELDAARRDYYRRRRSSGRA